MNILESKLERSSKVIKETDRCDRCIQKAAYMVVFNQGDLYFCNHHFRQYEDTFIAKAIDIYDEDDEVLMPSGASDIA